MTADGVERWSAAWAWLYTLFAGDPRSNREIVQLAAPTSGDVVVDIGCGAGAAVRRAAAGGAEAIGIDPSAAMVAAARRRSRDAPGTRFDVGHAAALPLADDQATIAWAIATVHHWPDREAGLIEVRRVLRRGGRLLLGERQLRRPRGHGLSIEEAEGAAEQLQGLGFERVAVQSRRLRLTTMVVIQATAP